MPKLQLTDSEMADRRTLAEIDTIKLLKNLDDSEMAKKLGVCTKTFQSRLRKPETFTLRELRILAKMSEDPVRLLGRRT